jgi:hypothetical protein
MLVVLIITVVAGVMVWHQELMNGGEDRKINIVKDGWEDMSN